MSTTPRTDAAALSAKLRQMGWRACLEAAATIDRLTREREAQAAELAREPRGRFDQPIIELPDKHPLRIRAEKAEAERDALTAALASSEARVREAFMAGYRTWPAVEGNDERAERVLTHWLKPAAALHAPPSGEQAGVTPHTWTGVDGGWFCATCGLTAIRKKARPVGPCQPPASEASRPTGEPT